MNEKNFDLIREKVLLCEISLPKRQSAYLIRLFKKPKTILLTGENFNEYLKLFLFTSCEIPVINLPNFNTSNYFEIGNFLRGASVMIKSKKQDLLIYQCQFGYFLELFYQLHVEKKMKNETNENFDEVVHKEFDISSRHANTLRWLGRLWWNYKKSGHLGMSLSKFYSHKTQVETLFKNHPILANE